MALSGVGILPRSLDLLLVTTANATQQVGFDLRGGHAAIFARQTFYNFGPGKAGRPANWTIGRQADGQFLRRQPYRFHP